MNRKKPALIIAGAAVLVAGAIVLTLALPSGAGRDRQQIALKMDARPMMY